MVRSSVGQGQNPITRMLTYENQTHKAPFQVNVTTSSRSIPQRSNSNAGAVAVAFLLVSLLLAWPSKAEADTVEADTVEYMVEAGSTATMQDKLLVQSNGKAAKKIPVLIMTKISVLVLCLVMVLVQCHFFGMMRPSEASSFTMVSPVADQTSQYWSEMFIDMRTVSTGLNSLQTCRSQRAAGNTEYSNCDTYLHTVMQAVADLFEAMVRL